LIVSFKSSSSWSATERREVLIHEPFGLGRERHAQRIAAFLGLFLAPRVERQRLALLSRLGDRAARVVDRGRRNESGLVVVRLRQTRQNASKHRSNGGTSSGRVTKMARRPR
jgi:hypothetical protein